MNINPVILLMAALLPFNANLAADHAIPEDLHLRTIYFARPAVIDGDKFQRQITSVELVCSINDGKTGTGVLIVDEGGVKFNKFGDGAPIGPRRVRRHPFSLQRIETENPKYYVWKSLQRSVYEMVFEDEFCDQQFYLNLCRDRSRSHLLVACRDPDEDEKKRSSNPVVNDVFELQVEQPPKLTESIYVHATQDSINLQTPNLLRLSDDLNNCGINIYGTLGDSGQLVYQNTPAASLQNYGDLLESRYGDPRVSINLVERNVKDPLNRGRRIFSVEPYSPGQNLIDHLPDAEVTLMVSPLKPEPHRLIVSQGNTIHHVIALVDWSWKDFSAKVGLLTDEISIGSVLRLRKNLGNQLSFRVNDGVVSTISLKGDLDEEKLRHITELEHLKHLQLYHCRQMTDGAMDLMGRLQSLNSIAMSDCLNSDRMLESVSRLPGLQGLRLTNQEPSPERFDHVSDHGIRELEKAVNLEVLALWGDDISDRALLSLAKLKKLKRLELKRTKITLSGLIDLAIALPDCSIMLEKFEGPRRRLFHVADGGRQVSIPVGIPAAELKICFDKVKTLKSLRLPTTTTNETLKYLSTRPSVESINIGGKNSHITDEGIRYLTELPNLKRLILSYHDRLTDACVKDLASLKSLEQLSLGMTGISDVAMRELELALPNCKITHRD